MMKYKVEATSVRKFQKHLVLSNESGMLSSIFVHRFAMIGPGDNISVTDSSVGRRIAVESCAGGNDIVVLPRYETYKDVRFGAGLLNLRFSEIGSESDFHDYQRLAQFHYKGADLQAGKGDIKSPGGGRRAILIASIFKGGFSRAIGYIEIQMPLLMCKPRHDLFSRPYRNGGGVSWETWLGDGQKYVNRIARIARVVVDPEFRGIGLSTILVSEAKRFCAERWHIGGARPLFIEISAEMLRYMDFVSRAGLHFVGYTEGNLRRIAKDLHSIEKGAAGKSGIMSLQRKYHAAFTAYCEKTGRSFDEARLVLSELLEAEDPRSEMASDEWLAFRPILRFPIPYFIGGIDEGAGNYIVDGLTVKRGLAEGGAERSSCGEVGVDSLEYIGLEVFVNYEIPTTPYVRLVMDSFGIESNRISNRLIGPVDVALSRGTVSLITGASGAGKSVLLHAISSEELSGGLRKVISKGGGGCKVRSLNALPDGVPIFQYFADLYGPEKAFDALCHVGLSEAMVFIKPFELLSMGQRYRAMFADLILSDAELWILDEFCSNLDPVTSRILSIKLKKLAQRRGCFVVVAAANANHFLEALSPNQVYVVRMGGKVIQMTAKEYANGFFNEGF